ncbi:hypothetical protein [Helicobacter marmotae]|uniref:hypothetical protein n=1 Tax=Helicobacter marmotae TaxID=152490 RepID=UPI001315A750|nr:hypothetical protein [Helicobacter marmotae]
MRNTLMPLPLLSAKILPPILCASKAKTQCILLCFCFSQDDTTRRILQYITKPRLL